MCLSEYTKARGANWISIMREIFSCQWVIAFAALPPSVGAGAETGGDTGDVVAAATGVAAHSRQSTERPQLVAMTAYVNGLESRESVNPQRHTHTLLYNCPVRRVAVKALHHGPV